MKRYLLFCSQLDMTEGGWDDMHLDADSIQELQDHFKEANEAQETWPSDDWAHVVDTQTGKKVSIYRGDDGWDSVSN